MTPGMGTAVWLAIIFGLIVQVIAFLIARSFGPEQLLAGWGIGSILRLVTLLGYGWGVVPALHLALTPSLVTLAVVYFVTMLIEPLLLARSMNSRPRSTRGPTI